MYMCTHVCQDVHTHTCSLTPVGAEKSQVEDSGRAIPTEAGGGRTAH